DDTVSLSNLQRQVQFGTEDIGQSKIGVLAARMRAINPEVKTGALSKRLDATNATILLEDHDLILDGTDSFATRFAVNDAALALGTPLLSGAVGRFDAQLGLFGPPGPCYRCFVPDLPPQEETCAETGVVGALTGIAGSAMALEAIKWITGAGETLAGRLWVFDGLGMTSRTVGLSRDPECPACFNL
ncbi:MAG: HesA/MoeB/ThiF family protein, partial [Litorimonas sp.]